VRDIRNAGGQRRTCAVPTFSCVLSKVGTLRSAHPTAFVRLATTVIARSEATTQSSISLLRQSWIASLSLAMTVRDMRSHSRGTVCPGFAISLALLD
jgi:hypothetical protein